MGWSPGLNSIHPGSTSEAPIGLIKKTSTIEGLVPMFELDTPRVNSEAPIGLIKKTSTNGPSGALPLLLSAAAYAYHSL